MAGEGAIRMGSKDNPVVLDFYQTIVEVGWPTVFDYAVVPISVFYEWNAQDSFGEGGEIHRDWEPGETCIEPEREVADPQPGGPGTIVANYLTGLRQSISFGVEAKLRRKRKKRNADGDVETIVEWVSGTIAQPLTGERFGFPKEKIYGTFNYVGSTTNDSVNAAPAFEMFVREPTEAEVFDKDGEIVYVEGAESTDHPTSGAEEIPYRVDSTLRFYMWGYSFTEEPKCTHFNTGSTSTSYTLMAAATSGPEEFENESVDLSGIEIIVKRMRFRQVGMAMDADSNIGILFERTSGDEEPTE